MQCTTGALKTVQKMSVEQDFTMSRFFIVIYKLTIEIVISDEILGLSALSELC